MPLNRMSEELERIGIVHKEEKKLREVKVWQLLLFFLMPLVLIPLVIVFMPSIIDGENTAALVLFILAIYILLRFFAMGCIYVYKAFAPMSVRDRCRYTPSCSSYTLISIRRYGIILGVMLGVMRINRCKPPYGGEDPPTISHILRLFGKCTPPCEYKPN